MLFFDDFWAWANFALISIGDPKKYKLEDVKLKKPAKLSALDNASKNSDFIKRSREEFRRSIVDIIM